ncbi:MAG: hypothetical protein J7L15_06240, partial [Clostridiales bacterium]|nr:hypothetical protein [Clostridiales bacterium]
MANVNLTIKINNIDATDSYDVLDNTKSINIGLDYFTITWESSSIDVVDVNPSSGEIEGIEKSIQYSYEIRISSSFSGLGTSEFIGDLAFTGVVPSENRFWRYRGVVLTRGETYYGQVKIIDELSQSSEWEVFSFHFNALPVVTNVIISPSSPVITDELTLSYDFNDNDDGSVESGTVIRWYKNGVVQDILQNSTTIKSEFLQNNDTWSVSILPSDGFEYGARVESFPVIVSSDSVPVSVSVIRVLPESPNENDILKAEYSFSNASEEGNVSTRWFVNDLLIFKFNEQVYIRPDVVPGDEVRCEIKHSQESVYVSSEIVKVVSSDFVISKIFIESEEEPLDVSVISPVVRWSVNIPYGKAVQFIKVKIGKFFGSDDVYSEIVETNSQSYKIPPNLIERGVDYYVSVAANETNSFDNAKYGYSHLRYEGSRWDANVSNSTGWTVETAILSDIPDVIDDTYYHFIRFQDGTKWGEVRIYYGKIYLLSQESFEYEVDTTDKFNLLTIVAKDSDIKIYLNRDLIIDGTGSFSQITTSKSIEVGNDSGFDMFVNYKYFYYTTSGSYFPDSSLEYSDLQFHEYMNFRYHEVVSLKGFLKDYDTYKQDHKVFAINPDIKTDGSSILAITPDKPIRDIAYNFVLDPKTGGAQYFINNISVSPDGNKVVFAYDNGVIVISGSLIYPYDSDMAFISEGEINEIDPVDYGWSLLNSFSSSSVFYDSDGLNINTATSEDIKVGGVCYYTQNKPGSKWVNSVSNEKGWTVDFSLTVKNVINNDSSLKEDIIDGLGVYVNDGDRKEVITFLRQEIIFSYA